ncbi:orotate phosphoribosyltransferase [Streptomyces sp. NPDC058240]|uniref:orotate phosphoribosyltransferase n=1 Tax=Streptomyces sp. NPDC058240 TaxID=3346396 RepID=UPI0036F0397C
MTLPAVTFAEKIAGAAYRPCPYQLPGGGTLDTYFDPYRLAGDPELLTETAAALAGLLPADTEALAGPALAGIPLVTAVSLHTGLPAAFLRPAPKEHGTWQQTEGADLGGRRMVLLDDTARSSTSLLHSARLLRMGGARVCTAVCVLDRDAGAATLLADHHMVLRALVRNPDGTR